MRYNISMKIIIIMLSLGMMVTISSKSKAEELEDVKLLQKILAVEDLVAMNYWYPGDETFLCIVVSSIGRANEDQDSPRKLKIFKKVDTRFVQTFEFGTCDSFHVTYLFGENHLLTLWTTGVAFCIRMFSWVDGECKMTLEIYTRLLPEIVDIDNDGRDELFITNGHFLVSPEDNRVIQYPDTTDIYTWNGESYQLLKKVPWENRFSI